MTGVDIPWDDLHHLSYFLPDLSEVESSFPSPVSPGPVHPVLNPLAPAQVFFEGNMVVISPTILVNISRDPKIIENVFLDAEFSPDDFKFTSISFKSLEMCFPSLMKKFLV